MCATTALVSMVNEWLVLHSDPQANFISYNTNKISPQVTNRDFEPRPGILGSFEVLW